MPVIRWLLGHLLLIMLVAAGAYFFVYREELGLVSAPEPAQEPAPSTGLTQAPAGRATAGPVMPGPVAERATPPDVPPATAPAPVPADPQGVRDLFADAAPEPDSDREVMPAAPPPGEYPPLEVLPSQPEPDAAGGPLELPPMPADSDSVPPAEPPGFEPLAEPAPPPPGPAQAAQWSLPAAPLEAEAAPSVPAEPQAPPPPPSDTTADIPPPDPLQAARKAYWEGRFDVAEAGYLALLAEQGEDAGLLRELAATQLAAGRPAGETADSFARAALALVREGRGWEIPPLLNQVFVLDYRRGRALEQELGRLQPPPAWR